MKIKPKAVAGVGALAFTATGWGLYGSKANQQPEKILSSEEVRLPAQITVQPTPVEVSLGEEINTLVNENIKFVWEINARDSIIDHKNEIIEELNKSLEKREKRNKTLTKEFIKEFNDNFNLKKRIKELEAENKAYKDAAAADLE